MHAFLQIQTSTAQEVRNDVAVQPAGVEFHSDGALALIEADAANAIHVAGIGQRKSLAFSGLRAVTEKDFQLRDSGMIATGTK